MFTLICCWSFNRVLPARQYFIYARIHTTQLHNGAKCYSTRHPAHLGDFAADDSGVACPTTRSRCGKGRFHHQQQDGGGHGDAEVGGGGGVGQTGNNGREQVSFFMLNHILILL